MRSLFSKHPPTAKGIAVVVLAANLSRAETITSQALTSEDISDTITGQGALQSNPTSGAPSIDGLTTTLITGVTGGSEPSVMTYRVTGDGFDFTYDLTVSAYASEAGVETLVNRRNNSGRIMPDSFLAGEHRQRIDSPDTVGDGNWEFLRLELGMSRSRKAPPRSPYSGSTRCASMPFKTKETMATLRTPKVVRSLEAGKVESIMGPGAHCPLPPLI